MKKLFSHSIDSYNIIMYHYTIDINQKVQDANNEISQILNTLPMTTKNKIKKV